VRRPDIPTVKCVTCNAERLIPAYVGVGQVLQGERIAAGLTIKALTEFLSLSVTYIQDLEHDRRQWNWAMIANYRRAIRKAVAKRIGEREEAA
jgi:hypothetical protein